MSRIDDLIAKYCPNGVEHKTLGEVFEIKTGNGITKKDAVENGKYPIISGGVEPMGYYSQYNRDADTVTIARAGTAGYVNYITTKFWVNDKCFSVIPKEKYKCAINTKYVFFYLKNIEAQIVALKSTGSVPTVNIQKLSKIKVAVPPLAVQEEIVNILDSFTLLEAELEAELEARKKQYEHYRDKLLNFADISQGGVRTMALSEIAPVLRGKRLTKSQLIENGAYPVFHGGIEPLGYYDQKNRDSNSVMVINVGASAGTVGFSSVDFWSSDGCFTIGHSDICLSKYLYYVLVSKEQLLKSRVRVAGIPTLDNAVVEKIQIPVPPLEEQERIVSILDKFDALVNDISDGLPAEINARRQQYEYYRDKLLNFEPMAA